MSGVQVSFDRPYGKYVQIFDNPLSQGSGEFLLWEFPLAFWMEQHGYDVTYCSNTDVHDRSDVSDAGQGVPVGRPRRILEPGAVRPRAGGREGRRQRRVPVGQHLLLRGCRTSPSSARGAATASSTRAGRYGGIRPKEKPCMADLPVEAPNEATLIGAQTVTPFNGSGDWIVTKPEHWMFAGTGMKKGDRIPGLVGWEFHGEPADIPGLEVVAEGPTWTGGDAESHYTATIYPGPKGNLVFNASTIFWRRGCRRRPATCRRSRTTAGRTARMHACSGSRRMYSSDFGGDAEPQSGSAALRPRGQFLLKLTRSISNRIAQGKRVMAELLTDHPRDDLLAAFRLGRLDEFLAATVGLHLETCLSCRDRVAGAMQPSASATGPLLLPGLMPIRITKSCANSAGAAWASYIWSAIL